MSADLTPVTELTAGQIIYIHGLIAFLGALVHAANAHRNGLSKSVADYFFLTMMSSFSGIMFFLVAASLFPQGYLTIAITGAGSYMGVDGLTWIVEVLKNILQKGVSKKVE